MKIRLWPEAEMPLKNASSSYCSVKQFLTKCYLIIFITTSFFTIPAIQKNVTAQTAKEKLSQVSNAVHSVASDAKLIFVTGDDLSLSGKSSTWIYVFKSESKNRLYEYWYDEGKVVAKTTITQLGEFSPTKGMGYLPENWMDSNEILTIAESNGGSSFRASHGGNAAIGVGLLPSAFESTGNAPHLYPVSAWEISYRWNDTYFDITINAQSGEVITNEPFDKRTLKANELILNMDSLAKRLTADAGLFRIWSPLVDLQGKSGEWIFEYHSISRQTTFLCTYYFSKIRREAESNQPDHNYSTANEIPDTRMNSDSAIIVAESLGGLQFRNSHPNTEINIRMEINESSLPQWNVNYNSPTGSETFQIIAINTENLVNKAQTKLEQVKTLAETYASDAELVFVTSGNISETGNGEWHYVFKSVSQQQLYEFYSTLLGDIILAEGVTGFFSKEDFLNSEPFPDSWLPIDAALIISENRGGSEFRQNYPDWRINVFLFTDINNNNFEWDINYNSEETGNQIHFFIDATARSTTDDWPKIYGGDQADIGLSVQETNDEGFIIAGYSYSFGNGTADPWLIKTDKFGNLEWDKIYVTPYNSYGAHVEITDENEYLIALNTADSSGVYSGNLLLTDTNGNEKLGRMFGSGGSSEVNSILQTTDNSYIMAGSCSTTEGEPFDFWLIKIDDEGNELWRRTYGGAGDDMCNSLQQLPDGGYILFGTTNSYGAGESDFWLLKTDENGNKIWDTTFGGLSIDEGKSLKLTSDEGFILAGLTESYGEGGQDCYLIKTDKNGNEEWSKTFGSQNDDLFDDVIQTPDGGYISVGTTMKNDNRDILIIKTDSSGNEIWDRVIGEEWGDAGKAICKTSDGKYAITGRTRSWGANVTDIFLIKIEDSGNITQLSKLKMPENISLSNYPNPFNRYTNICLNIKRQGKYTMRVIDLSGKEITVLLNRFLPEGQFEFSWNGQNQNRKIINPGVYFLELYGEKDKKIIKLIKE